MAQQRARTFKNLVVGDVFRFSETDEFVEFVGKENGPWRKVSARHYKYFHTPASSGKAYRVGTVRTTVKNVR